MLGVQILIMSELWAGLYASLLEKTGQSTGRWHQSDVRDDKRSDVYEGEQNINSRFVCVLPKWLLFTGDYGHKGARLRGEEASSAEEKVKGV